MRNYNIIKYFSPKRNKKNKKYSYYLFFRRNIPFTLGKRKSFYKKKFSKSSLKNILNKKKLQNKPTQPLISQLSFHNYYSKNKPQSISLNPIIKINKRPSSVKHITKQVYYSKPQYISFIKHD